MLGGGVSGMGARSKIRHPVRGRSVGYARAVVSFELPPHLADLRTRVRAFVDDNVIPAEKAILEEDRDKRRDTLNGLRARARAEASWLSRLPVTNPPPWK